MSLFNLLVSLAAVVIAALAWWLDGMYRDEPQEGAE